MSDYRRPGVYLEERLGSAPNETPNVTSVGVFVGLAAKGPVEVAEPITSWTDFVQKFGGFSGVAFNTPAQAGSAIADPPMVWAPSGSNTLTIESGEALFTAEYVGSTVSGAGVAVGTRVTAISLDGETATLDQATTADIGDISTPGAETGAALTFTTPTVQGATGITMSYLAYAVYSYYQNGGRSAFVVRIAPASSTQQGAASTAEVLSGPGGGLSMRFTANGRGAWGNSLAIRVQRQATMANGRNVFSLSVLRQASLGASAEVLETFTNLSMTGDGGTRPAVAVINDPLAGSRLVSIESFDTAVDPAEGTVALVGGEDLGLPLASDFSSNGVQTAVRSIESPTLVTLVPFKDGNGSVVMPPPQTLGAAFSTRGDSMVIWDSNPLSLVSTDHATDTMNRAAQIGTGDSYAAIYTPWVVVPDPALPGSTLAIPPSGAVIGMMARIDLTDGPWRAPAGITAVLSNAISPEVRYTEADQGRLNNGNVNVVRAIPGSGICVMGARTRKLYGPDRYLSNRRMIIFLKERLRLSTQFAVFQNNDQRLWAALRNVATRVLNPIWEQGGLRGANANEAYFVRCDGTINTPQVIQSGEVRMQVGVALQSPAEFVVIQISQFEAGTSTVSEIVS